MEKTRHLDLHRNRRNQTSIRVKPARFDAGIERLNLRLLELEAQNAMLQETNARLSREAAHYSTLFERVPIGQITLDRRYEILDVNGVAAALMGDTSAHLIGSSFLHRVAKEGHEQLLSSSSRAKNSKKRVTLIVTFSGGKSPAIPIELTLSPSFDSKGDFLCYYATAADIRERLQKDRIINEQRAQLLESGRLSALGEMAANIAHEVNNPLAIIVGQTTQLKKLVPGTDARACQSVDKIEATAFRISKIISALQRLSSGGPADTREDVPLQSIYDDVLQVCGNRFAQADIRLTVKPVSPALQIECNSVQIAQVLLNLLSNSLDAVKVMPGPKWVVVETEDAPDGLSISITDSGPIPPNEIQSKLFEPFFTTKGVGQGSGLGLSVSNGIVRSHGGSLVLDATGSTTTFRMTLPKN